MVTTHKMHVLSVTFLLLLCLQLCLAMEGSQSYWRQVPSPREVGHRVKIAWYNTQMSADYPRGGPVPSPRKMGGHGVNNAWGNTRMSPDYPRRGPVLSPRKMWDHGVHNASGNTRMSPVYPRGGPVPSPRKMGDHGMNNAWGNTTISPGLFSGPGFGGGCSPKKGLCSEPHHP
jgi:hypothetical protein